jgi:hypothetical protein
MGEGILFAVDAKCNQELDPGKRSGLIAGPNSASIGKTYHAICETFEHEQ